jgi:hypothetical protein
MPTNESVLRFSPLIDQYVHLYKCGDQRCPFQSEERESRLDASSACETHREEECDTQSPAESIIRRELVQGTVGKIDQNDISQQ